MATETAKRARSLMSARMLNRAVMLLSRVTPARRLKKNGKA